MPAPDAISSRPPRRGRRPKTYAAVLEATAGLLESTSLAELSVAQILSAADVGRTSFYEHFSSKDDVVVQLMRSISAEVGAELEPMFDRGQRTPDAAFRDGLTTLITRSSRYAPLLVAVAEEWPAVPELRSIWFRMHGQLTARLAQTIERDRAAGIAPAGADSEALAASLIWTVERAFHVAMTGRHPTLVDQDTLIEPLTQLFVGSIYGRAASTTSASRFRR
jgi:TetR/AcrR family transcriptional regulator, ethionamide resistance regulator